VHRISFNAPRWATSVAVDVTMERAQWDRFTDFGVTLFDSAGRQIEKQPQNYAFGRLQASLPSGHVDMPIQLALFPAFADPGADEPWTARVAIRLYADSAIALTPAGSGPASLTVRPGRDAARSFEIPESPWRLGDGFFPLGILIARVGEQSWTREGGLPLPNPPVMR
jgi:hypothetical protein